MPPTAETYAKAYANMKAREDSKDLLDANKRGRYPRSAAAGLLAGAPALALGSLGPLTRLPSDAAELQKRYSYHMMHEMSESLGQSPAMIDSVFKGMNHQDEAIRKASNRIYGNILETLERRGVKTKIPTKNLLMHLAKSIKAPATIAAPMAALGAAFGVYGHSKKLKRRQKLLDEAQELQKTSSVNGSTEDRIRQLAVSYAFYDELSKI